MKTVGIKLADGSFYPIMEEGTAQQKKLNLTTAHNNQTCVMVDLYRSENCTMEDAEYHRCVAYWKGAEVLGKYLVKGKRIYVEGRLRTRKWQDSEGADKFSTEIIVDSFIFLDSKWEWAEEESFWVEGGEPEPAGMDEDMPF